LIPKRGRPPKSRGAKLVAQTCHKLKKPKQAKILETMNFNEEKYVSISSIPSLDHYLDRKISTTIRGVGMISHGRKSNVCNGNTTQIPKRKTSSTLGRHTVENNDFLPSSNQIRRAELIGVPVSAQGVDSPSTKLDHTELSHYLSCLRHDIIHKTHVKKNQRDL